MYFIIALILGVGLSALVLWLRNRNIAVKWYEWLIGSVGLLLLLFTIQNFAASLAEYESAAAYLFLLVTGLPSLILLTVAGILARRRHSAAG